MDATVSAVVRQRLAMVFVRGDVDGKLVLACWRRYANYADSA